MIRVAHYPPYCSKFNPIEHRLFPHVTRALSGVILKTVELVIEEAPWRGHSRNPRRQNHDLAAVRIARDETDLRIAVKKAGGVWRPRQKLCEMTWGAFAPWESVTG